MAIWDVFRSRSAGAGEKDGPTEITVDNPDKLGSRLGAWGPSQKEAESALSAALAGGDAALEELKKNKEAAHYEVKAHSRSARFGWTVNGALVADGSKDVPLPESASAGPLQKRIHVLYKPPEEPEQATKAGAKDAGGAADKDPAEKSRKNPVHVERLAGGRIVININLAELEYNGEKIRQDVREEVQKSLAHAYQRFDGLERQLAERDARIAKELPGTSAAKPEPGNVAKAPERPRPSPSDAPSDRAHAEKAPEAAGRPRSAAREDARSIQADLAARPPALHTRLSEAIKEATTERGVRHFEVVGGTSGSAGRFVSPEVLEKVVREVEGADGAARTYLVGTDGSIYDRAGEPVFRAADPERVKAQPALELDPGRARPEATKDLSPAVAHGVVSAQRNGAASSPEI